MSWYSRYMLVIIISSIFFTATSHAAHMYYIGVLTSFSNNQMVVDGRNYPLSQKIKVILRIVGNNDAIHEKPGRLSDISVGNTITIKVSNGEITEIEKIVSR